MRVPYEWLRTYCAPDLPLRDLEERLTLSGTKVEAIHHHGVGGPDGFVVGKVLEAVQHPDADRLRVCTVDVGADAPATIVCGAPNVAAGQTVAVARPGAVMPDGTTLAKAKLRGVASEGMILAEDELAIGTDHAGIMVLGDDLAPGTPLADVLPIATEVIEFEITPNRPDCLGVYGIAREVHAATGAPLAPAPWEDDPGGRGGPSLPGVSIHVAAPELNPRFTARVFEDVTIAPSPPWLKARLMAAGVRPISNVVDITNYTMLLTGHPLHAFDLDRVAGGQLTVRRAAEGEQVETLDGQTRTLDADMLVIEDAEGPTSIAGVMGGARSEVHDGTTRVLMEVATWIGHNILRTSNLLGLRSEASSRFEKGLAPEQAMEAQAVATKLMLELTGARLVPGTVDAGPFAAAPWPEPVLRLRDRRVSGLLGMAIPRERQELLLAALGFATVPAGDGLDVTVPPFRRYDVTREADLVEEVGRFDLDALPATLPARRDSAGKLPLSARLRRRALDAVVGRGAHEVVGWSFTEPGVADRLRLGREDPRRRFVALANPMSEDHAVLRTTLLGSLLDAAHHNAARGATDLLLAEQGAVYLDRDDAAAASGGGLASAAASPGGASSVPGSAAGSAGGVSPAGSDDVGASVDATAFADGATPAAVAARVLPHEHRALGVLLAGRLHSPTWGVPDPPRAGFFAAKGLLAAVLDALRVPWSVEPAAEPFLHPGRSARVIAGGEDVGWLGELHPLVARAWDLEDQVAAFEIDLDRVVGHAVAVPHYRDLTSYPPVRRDLAVVVADDVPAEQVVTTIRDAGGDLLTGARVFDVYQGAQLGAGRKSLAVALTFQAPDRTLTDEEVAPVRERIVTALAERVGGELRG